jgi:hypothetical protein
MTFIISLLAIFGLAFLIKESEGPWGCMSWLRNQLMQNKHVGVFFYKLLDCYFCVGCHCGWIVYLLSAPTYSIQFFILWTLAGGVISLILDALLGKLRAA